MKGKKKTLIKIDDLVQGQTFEYKGNYFIVDDQKAVVQLTGKKSGLVCLFGSYGCGNRINRNWVKIKNLEIGEIQ